MNKDKAILYGYYFSTFTRSADIFDFYNVYLKNHDMIQTFKKIVENEYNTIQSFLDEYREICFDGNNNKKIPDRILNNDKIIMEAFLNGYCLAHFSYQDEFDIMGYTFIDIKGVLSCKGMLYLMKELGYNVGCTENSEDSIYRIYIYSNDTRKRKRDQLNI